MVAQLRAPARETDRDVIFSHDGVVALTIGQHRWYAHRTLRITGVLISAGTAPQGADLVADVMLDGGGSVYISPADRPTVLDGTNEGLAPQPNSPNLNEGHYLTVDIVQIGTAVAGSDVDVRILYE